MPTLFSKIIAGDIPSHKVAETNRYFAFLDINPIAKGHTLVVPKHEVDYFFDLPQKEIDGLMAFAKTMARAIDQQLQPLRTGLIIQGLEVPHAHLHLVPLYHKTQPMALGHNVQEFSDEEMAAIAQTIGEGLV